MPINPGFVISKDEPKRAHLFVFLAVLVVSCVFWQGCSAVPQSLADPLAKKPADPVRPSAQHSASSMTLPAATVGTSYQVLLSADGVSAPEFVVNQSSLPSGLTLNTVTGTISGTPTQAGGFTFTVAVKADGHGVTSTCTYSLTVKPNNNTSVVSLQLTPTVTSVKSGGKVQFSAAVQNTSNTAVTWSTSAGSVSASGLFTAPISSSSSTITVTATSVADPAVHANATASVTSSLFVISTTSLPSGVQSTPYSASLSGTGGVPPYQWSIVSGSLPSGLQLDPSSGTLSGSPIQTGTFPLTIQGMDSTSQTAQQSYSLVISAPGNNCGPPTYPCSRTDQGIVQIPSTIPNIGNLQGANSIITDPNFGNRIVRITDAATNPSSSFQNRTFVTASSGSADENLWNLDSTLFIVQDSGARAYPYTFDPIALQASRMYVPSYPATNGLTLMDSGVWSRVSSNILYVASGTTINKYDFTDRNNAPSPQLVYDFTSSPNCLPAGFKKTWQSRGGVSGDDTVMAMAYSNQGAQGTGVYAVVYKIGSGCSMLNTGTGQVTGDWGSQGSINLPDRWTIHNVKLSKDGNWLIIARQSCSLSSCLAQPYFWQIGTTNVVACGRTGQCDGHWTEGYSHWVNNNNTPIGNQNIRQFGATISPTALTFSFPSGLRGIFDEHQSWNNVDPADSVPFASTTWSSTTPFPSPWFNEIIAVAADGSGTTWRFAHSFITTQSQNFSTKYGIGSVSQDGKFFMFSSDWMGTLGSESGSSTCTIGTNCRGDVFVVELR